VGFLRWKNRNFPVQTEEAQGGGGEFETLKDKNGVFFSESICE
jgi:hypothetical protein